MVHKELQFFSINPYLITSLNPVLNCLLSRVKSVEILNLEDTDKEIIEKAILKLFHNLFILHFLHRNTVG